MISAAVAIAAATISVAVPTGTFTTTRNADLAAGHVPGASTNRSTRDRAWTMKNTAPGHLINPPQGGTYRVTGTSVAFTNLLTGGTFTARLALRAGSASRS